MMARKGYDKILGVKFDIDGKTTSKKGKREYMRHYMKIVRDRERQRRFSPRKPLPLNGSPLVKPVNLPRELQKLEKKRKKRFNGGMKNG